MLMMMIWINQQQRQHKQHRSWLMLVVFAGVLCLPILLLTYINTNTLITVPFVTSFTIPTTTTTSSSKVIQQQQQQQQRHNKHYEVPLLLTNSNIHAIHRSHHTSKTILLYSEPSMSASTSSSTSASASSSGTKSVIISQTSTGNNMTSTQDTTKTTTTTPTATEPITDKSPFIIATETVEDDKNMNGDVPTLSSTSVVVDERQPQLRRSTTTTNPIGTATTISSTTNVMINDDDHGNYSDNHDDTEEDIYFMKMAIELAQSDGGEHGPLSAYPNPTVGAILVSHTYDPINNDIISSTIIGRGKSDYQNDAIHSCLIDAGFSISSLSEWVVSWPLNSISNSNNGDNNTSTNSNSKNTNLTLYTTLEPSTRRRGTAVPPITNLIRNVNTIQRIVIGCTSPIPEETMVGATTLHKTSNIHVSIIQNHTIRTACQELIHNYIILSNSKLHRMARKHYQLFHRPLGFLHCSVIHSDNIDAFHRHGNTFGTNFGTLSLSYRNFGAYELAPPPDTIWATTTTSTDDNNIIDNDDDESNSGNSKRIDDEFVMIDFEDEEEIEDDNQYKGVTTSTTATGSPMMPWYNEVDAIVCTFPRSGNGPPNDDSIMARLNGLIWLATHGNQIAPGVERILVLDATELQHLPLTNDNINLPKHVDIESFWSSYQNQQNKPIRLLLRRGIHEGARVAAHAASIAAQAAANVAIIAANAIETGDATNAANAALEYEMAILSSKQYIEYELERTQIIRRKLEEYGVIVETIEGGEPIDVMEHLGKRNGYHTVVWRAGCWGERGVKAILAGAFQWVSAHIAVPANGGQFWQLLMAENAVQGACGPQSKVKVFADQNDISMEYCDDTDDCILSVDGKPIRHVRLDCRIALVDAERKREFDIAKTQTMNRKVLVEQAPWFI